MNQYPGLPSGSFNLVALAHKLPIKFFVNIPCDGVGMIGIGIAEACM
jgi:hypothetical protein